MSEPANEHGEILTKSRVTQGGSLQFPFYGSVWSYLLKDLKNKF